MNDNSNSAKLVVNETIDGEPLDKAKAKIKSESKKDEPVKRPKADPYIWGIYILLLIASVIEVFSASSIEVTNKSIYGPLIGHCKYLLGGFIIVLLFQNIHYKWFRKWAVAGAILCAGLVVLSNFKGVEANGAQRALELGSYTIQPAEMIKLAVVVWLARIMAKHQMSGGVTTKGVVLSAVIVLFFSGLVFKNGLTNMILIMCVSVSMFIIGGIQWRKLGIVMLCYGVLGGGFAYHHFSDKKADKDEFTTTQTVENENDVKIDRSGTQKGRIARFLEGVTPNDTITDENRQVMYANFALAHGGLLGQGPGNSRESARVPLAFSDYIYSIVVEEIGFVGGALLLVIYLLLVARAGAIASKCSRAFPALLIMGCAVLIAFQALVHMAIVTGFFPVSGQPLPLISKGGTSIMIMSLAIGMMLSVSKYAVRSGNKKEIRKELGELPDEMKSANPTEIRKD